MNRPRTDWLVCAVYVALPVALCGAATFIGWLAQRAYAAWWPWISAHAENIAAVVLFVCVVVLFVLAVAEKAKRNNPSW